MDKLLQYFTPEHYDLHLKIDRTHDLIEGTVKLRGEAKSDVVKLHSVDMEILSVALENSESTTSANSKNATIAKPNISPIEQLLDFKHADGILEIFLPSAREVELTITFKTHLNQNMEGCYLSTYEYQGKTRKIAATQFESHYARETFPCIDEPAAKASFSLTLEIPDLSADDVVLANTPLKSRTTPSSDVSSKPKPTTNNRFTFESTPRMSTYLLAWVIGPFQSVSTVNKHGIKVTSYAAPNQPKESLIFANETAARALDFYDDKFGVKYPLPKLDQVALPDFEAGAMENWGLVTYRESCLLADKNAALETKQSVAITVAHELSHQWFGDLVTMAWWDDLWLNESFATMMEFVATDALYPEFNIWQDFFTSDCLAALRRDSLHGVQAVQQEVHDPAEIATLFDSAIVYAKGARLMLMLYRLMGDDAFMKGIRDYFKKYQYQNTIGDDLWNSLQPYADFSVKDFMHAWISQPGYPAITISAGASSPQTTSAPSQTVSTSPRAASASPQANIEPAQHRFLINGWTDDTRWPLPEVKDDMSGHYLLELDDLAFQDKLNHFEKLSLEQKLRLLIDRQLLAKTPDIPSASLLDLLPRFADETSAPVWEILTGVIGDLKLFCPPDTKPAEQYKRYLSRLYKSRFNSISFDPLTDENTIHVRDALLNIAYYVKDDNILSKLANMYDVAQPATPGDPNASIPEASSLKTLDPELRSHILAAKLHEDEAKIFPIFLEEYRTETDPELKSDLLFTIAGLSEQPEHLDQLINLLEQPEIVRPQDHIFLYIYLLRNHRTRLCVLKWLTTHWDYIKRLTGDKSVEDYPRYASLLIRTPEEAELFYDFFDPLMNDPILKRTLKMARTDIDCRLQTIVTDSSAVHEKLANLTKGE